MTIGNSAYKTLSSLNVLTTGSGDVVVGDVDVANISITGSGSVTLGIIKESLNATIVGSGSIYGTADPNARITKAIIGTGSVNI